MHHRVHVYVYWRLDLCYGPFDIITMSVERCVWTDEIQGEGLWKLCYLGPDTAIYMR